ncbi:MAG TPA: DUF3299 domain-containing protein [Hyphomicrobium sp.]|nr:DUF3299 domain-containing protein [Hyphomicrobium sp.]
MTKAIAAGVLGLLLISAVPGAVRAADAPLDLKWAQLMPPIEAVKPKPKTFFSGAAPSSEQAQQAGHDGPPPPSSYQEGAFMSMKRRQPGADLPPRVVAELDGKRVRIGGYVVPLDFEATTIKEFLLVPFVGACIHVPPPPANQIVYVKSDAGLEITGQFDPVWVTGTIKTEPAFTGLADTGYSLTAERIDPRPE